MATKLEFIQPKTRVQDWRVVLGGRCIGSVWRAAENLYIASVSHQEKLPTREAAFSAARKQARAIAWV